MGIFQQFPYTNFHEMNLDQIIKICKQLTDEWAQYQADWESYRTDMDTAFNDLKNYVINYFNNLDLDDAISDKLNTMAADGSLEQILEPMFTSLTTRVTALESAVAALTPIPAGSTSADAALDNIKIDYNGYSYDSPGNAVRGQIREVIEKMLNGNSTFIHYPFMQDLINHSTITTGQLLDNTGVPYANLAGAITALIGISPGIRYNIARSINSGTLPNAVFYDKQGNKVGLVDGHTQSFIAPYNAYQIRINMINNEASPGANTMYNQHLFINPVLQHEYDTIKMLQQDNIIDQVDKYDGVINIVDGVDHLNPSTSFKHTDLIPLIPGKTYVITRSMDTTTFPTVIIYNADGTYSRGITPIYLTGDTTLFTLSQNERFIRVNIQLSLGDCICKMVTNRLSGKITTFYGDSLTWYYNQPFTWGPHQGEICHNYMNYIQSHFVPQVIANAGGSGENTLQICNRIENAGNFNLTDYLFLMPSSMNDDRLDIPVGVLAYDTSTYDTTTIIGALQHAIETIYSQRPDIVITMITEPKGWTYRNNRFEMVDPKYVDAYKRVAEFYGIPVIDCWSQCGFNKAQWSLYYADPTDATNTQYIYHPNNAGWEKLSEYIVNELDVLYKISVE